MDTDGIVNFSLNLFNELRVLPDSEIEIERYAEDNHIILCFAVTNNKLDMVNQLVTNGVDVNHLLTLRR